MGKLDDVSAERLRRRLAEATEPKAVKRLMVALSYKDGERVDELSDRFGIPTSTIYYWLDRFEDRPIEDALVDEKRPGRPSRLDDDDREALAADLDRPPTAFGHDGDEWTPERVRAHLEAEYGVSYSVGHVRRLLRRLGDRE